MSEFRNVVGHEDIIGYIRSAASHDRLSHAYILNGERGSGKKTLAKLFAMTLQCESDGQKPCGICRPCRQAKGGNHPDIITVSHEKPASVGVDDIRAKVNDGIAVRPYSGRYRIYIIPDADMMTPGAQNALLKTLEEPPEYAVIFLLAENAESLLPTVRSRCVTLKLRSVGDELVKRYLMKQVHLPDYRAGEFAALAQGNIGKALTLASSERFGEIREDSVRLLERLCDMEPYEIAAEAGKIAEYKSEAADYLDIFTIWFRDVLIYKATAGEGRIVFGDRITNIGERAARGSYEGLENIFESIERARERLKANVGIEPVMELLLLAMKEN